MRLHRPIVLHEQPAGRLVVGAREVDPRVAVGRVGEGRDDEVDAAGRQQRLAGRRRGADVRDAALAAERVAGEPLRDLDVEAGVLALDVDVAERRRVALDADDEPLSRLDVRRQLRQRRGGLARLPSLSWRWVARSRSSRRRPPQRPPPPSPGESSSCTCSFLVGDWSTRSSDAASCSERRRNCCVRSSRGTIEHVGRARPPRRSGPRP